MLPSYVLRCPQISRFIFKSSKLKFKGQGDFQKSKVKVRSSRGFTANLISTSFRGATSFCTTGLEFGVQSPLQEDFQRFSFTSFCTKHFKDSKFKVFPKVQSSEWSQFPVRSRFSSSSSSGTGPMMSLPSPNSDSTILVVWVLGSRSHDDLRSVI